MVVTIYQELVKLFPPTWQHHHLMIASIIVSIIRWQASLTARDQYGQANPKLDASLLQCTLRSARSGAPFNQFLGQSYHSITSSARASSVGGTSSPSAFAVLRFEWPRCGSTAGPRDAPSPEAQWSRRTAGECCVCDCQPPIAGRHTIVGGYITK
jgi:hypothetical protein